MSEGTPRASKEQGSARSSTGDSVPEPDSDACGVWVVDAERIARVRREMWSDEAITSTAELLKVLGSETRIRILRALSLDELCVCDLSEVLSLSPSAVSHQLRELRRLKLVTCRQAGKLAYYRASAPAGLAILEVSIRLQGSR